MTTLQSTSERLEDALRRLAVEAADLFEELLAAGAELPFDLEPSDGPLPMYSYAPMTGRFIAEHLAELRRLEAFAEVSEICSEEVATGFLIGLWEGRSEFDVAGDRVKGAIDAVLAGVGGSAAGDGTPAGEVIVPLIGFHMPADELVLDGVRIVRAESVGDAPRDAVQGKGAFLARVSCGFADLAPAAAVADDLRRALRTLRLFRPGGVGIAAHGWARRADGWERFSTGAGRARNGGYRLTGNEVGDVRDFSRKLTERGARLPALAWAISRFELGAERPSLIEALSDYLLTLRGLLEGGGPANVGLAARVAALTAEPHEREQTRICVERALAIERKLMSGARYRPAAGSSPLAVIAELEELLRRILKGVATGELEGDLRTSADEILLSDGIVGAAAAQPPQPSMGGTAEWRLPDPVGDEEIDLSMVADGHLGGIKIRRASKHDPDEAETETHAEAGTAADQAETHESDRLAEPTRMIVTDVELPSIMGEEPERSATERGEGQASPGPFLPEPEPEADWFASADGELEWPAFASPRRGRPDEPRELDSEANDRVRYLFPVPDATDWDVGELRYDKRSTS